ncbi:hypothetical protein OZX68_06840 [Streptococcaceae bacterium ESL0729]|nr:hypothetical protein OZX68_06840 [Streptococcaceae bacterium ESL0729]
MRYRVFFKGAMLLSCLSVGLLKGGSIFAEGVGSEPSGTSSISEQVSSSLSSSQILSNASESSVASTSSDSSSTSEVPASPAARSIGPLAAVSTMDASTAYVGSLTDLTTALGNSNISNIILTADLSFGTNSYPVKRNITVDGQGKWAITYGGGNMQQGLYFSGNNITIYYKNISFGKASLLGSNNTMNAGNYYGIAPAGSDSQTGNTLIVENLSYFSDYGSQPIYLTGGTNKVVFRGTNTFNMMGGPYSQEFAEGSNFVFEDNSTTTVNDNNQYNLGFIYSATTTAPVNITIGENASFIVPTTRHDIIYSGASQVNVNIGKNGTFYAKQVTPVLGTGRFINQTGFTPNFTLAEGANLDIHSINTSMFQNITVNMPKNSSAVFSSANGDAMSINGQGNFNINDAARLLIEGGLSPNNGQPVGGNVNINFNTFGANTLGYNSYINTPTNSNYQSFVSQDNPGTWTGINDVYTRTGGPAFTTGSPSQTQSLTQTTFMSFVRNTPVSLAWSSDGSDTSTKNISLTTATDNAANYTGSFYWNDPGRFNNLVFQLWDSVTNTQVGADIANIASTPGDATFAQVNFTIPSANLPVKLNNRQFLIKAFRKTLDGNLTPVKSTANTNVNAVLAMNVSVDGMVALKSVPSQLNWTGRYMVNTKGILNRDSGNSMAFSVKDSRINTTPGWNLVATVQGSAPFSLVWKKNPSDTASALNNNAVFGKASNGTMTTGTTTSTDGNGSITYNKSWLETEGVLLKSDDYIPINSYSSLGITWTLVNAP